MSPRTMRLIPIFMLLTLVLPLPLALLAYVAKPLWHADPTWAAWQPHVAPLLIASGVMSVMVLPIVVALVARALTEVQIIAHFPLAAGERLSNAWHRLGVRDDGNRLAISLSGSGSSILGGALGSWLVVLGIVNLVTTPSLHAFLAGLTAAVLLTGVVLWKRQRRVRWLIIDEAAKTLCWRQKGEETALAGFDEVGRVLLSAQKLSAEEPGPGRLWILLFRSQESDPEKALLAGVPVFRFPPACADALYNRLRTILHLAAAS